MMKTSKQLTGLQKPVSGIILSLFSEFIDSCKQIILLFLVTYRSNVNKFNFPVKGIYFKNMHLVDQPKGWANSKFVRTNGHLGCTLSSDQQLFWALTYVKSCRITLAGIKGISTFCFWLFSQSKIFSTSFDFTWKPSQLRTADSSSTLIENGRRPKEVKYKIPLFNTLSTYLQYSIKFRDYSKCKDEVFMSFT